MHIIGSSRKPNIHSRSMSDFLRKAKEKVIEAKDTVTGETAW
jgi:hypothetical protein